MRRIPQKELRNHVGDVLRRAEAGEELEITVSGRPVARLLPLERRSFLPATEFSDVFRSPTDTAWLDDVRGFEADLADPFDLFA